MMLLLGICIGIGIIVFKEYYESPVVKGKVIIHITNGILTNIECNSEVDLEIKRSSK